MESGTGCDRRRWLRQHFERKRTSLKRPRSISNITEANKGEPCLPPIEGEESCGKDEQTRSSSPVEEKPGYLKARDKRVSIGQQVETVGLGIENNNSVVYQRNIRDTEYAESDDRKRKAAIKQHTQAVVRQGDKFVRDLQEGRMLFHGTGLEGKDPLRVEMENIGLESELLDEAHANYEPLDLAASCSPRALERRRLYLEEEARIFENANQSIEVKRQFLHRIQHSDTDANELHALAEAASSKAFGLFEKLRKQHKILSFEARALVRRQMLEKQAQASELRKRAKAAKLDVELLKKHMIQQGLVPETFVSTKDMPGAALIEETKEDATPVDEDGVPLNPSHSDKWRHALREGFKLGHLELLDRSQKRRDRITEAEKAKSIADRVEAEKIMKLFNKDKEEKRRLQRIKDGLESSNENDGSEDDDNEEETEDGPAKNINNNDDDSEEEDDAPIDHVAIAMAPPNFTAQSKVAMLGGDDHKRITRGMSKETAPPMCIDWGLLRCRLPHSECSGRHFYVSTEEQEEWNKKRAETGYRIEMRVLDAITRREATLDQLRLAGIECRKTFESHLSGYVKITDIAPLLKLISQLRIVTVLVVEAILKWRRHLQGSSVTKITSEGPIHQGQWIVKLGFEGKELYPPSSAFISKVKRFSRDAEVKGKREIKYSVLGVFPTKVEALRAYDIKMKQIATRNQSSVESLPRAKTIIRSCGKHFAIESDMGVPNTRCEICHAHSMSGNAIATPGYFWNGQNYLLKMISDSNFLGDIEILKLFFKSALDTKRFVFKRNPLLLAEDIRNGSKRFVEVVNGEPYSIDDHDANEKLVNNFGVPTNCVLVHKNKCVEWFGHISRSPQVTVGKDLAYISQLVANHSLVREFVDKHNSEHVDIIDMGRIRVAQRVIRQEQQLARFMTESRVAAKKAAMQLQLDNDKLARREERQRRRDEGEEDVPTSEDESEDEEKFEEDEFRPRGITTVDDILTENEILILTGQATTKSFKIQVETPAEKHPVDRMHTSYYFDRGEYLAIQQKRHEFVGKTENVWCSGEKGTMFEGMQVRGENRRHFEFEKKLKRRGQAMIELRARIQRRLAKSIRRGDMCNPYTIQQIVAIGREAGGSLLLMDCNKAEVFVTRWHRRVWGAKLIQRNIRKMHARVRCRQLRQEIARKAAQTLNRERSCARFAKSWTRKMFKTGIKRSKSILKRPIATLPVYYDGEPLLISVYNPSILHKHPRTESTKLIEPCFACLGMSKHTRKRRDLGWLSVRGKPCVEGDHAAEHGIVKLNRVEETSYGQGPCYCHREHVHQRDGIILKAYNPQNSRVYPMYAFMDKLLNTLQGLAEVSEDGDSIRACLKLVYRHGEDAVLHELNRIKSCSSAYRLCDEFRLTNLAPDYENHCHIYGQSKPEHIVDNWTQLQSELERIQSLSQTMEELREDYKKKNKEILEEEDWKRKGLEEARSNFQRAHTVKLASNIHRHAMIKVASDAMFFSTNQIELYDDLTKSSNQQAWDPKEDANNAIYIQRKWQAKKVVMLASKFRAEALERLFNAEKTFETQVAATKLNTNLLENVDRNMLHVKERLGEIQHARNSAWKLLSDFLHLAVKHALCLRGGAQGVATKLRRGLVLRQPKVIHGADENLLHRKGRKIYSPRFLKLATQSVIGIISIFEDAKDAPSDPGAPAPPPEWMNSVFTQRGLSTRQMNAHDPDGALEGRRFTESPQRLTLKQTLHMLVENVAAWEHDIALQWKMGFRIKDAVIQPPYIGMLRVAVFLQDQCKIVEWTVNPIELRELLVDNHRNLPGKTIPEVFSHRYVRDQFLKSGEQMTHNSMRNAVKSIRTKVLHRLNQLIHIGTFDHKIRLGKLDYFRLRRNLFSTLFKTQWWKDLRAGRSSLKGHKIYQGILRIGEETAVAVVFENCGDLTVQVSFGVSCLQRQLGKKRKRKKKQKRQFPRDTRVTIPDVAIRDALVRSDEFELVSLWKQAVFCCNYPTVLIEAVLRKFVLVSHTETRGGLCLTRRAQKSSLKHGTPYTGLRSDKRDIQGDMLLERFPFTDCDNPIRVMHHQDADLKIVLDQRDLYELVHRAVVVVSGTSLLVSGRVNYYGDIIIDGHCSLQSNLSLKLPRREVRIVMCRLGRHDLLSSTRRVDLCAYLFSLLAIRTALTPPSHTRDHPLFSRLCKMIQVGVPRGAVVQAILLDKEDLFSNYHHNEIIRVVLECNHDAPPPAKFRLPQTRAYVLVLSQIKVEEHFQLLHRGAAVTSAGIPYDLEILERNRNLWVRVRRETSTEKSKRVTSRELALMEEEDKLAREVAVFQARFLHSKRRFKSVANRRSEVKRSQVNVNRQTRVRHANASLKRGIYRQNICERLLNETQLVFEEGTKVSWPNDMIPFESMHVSGKPLYSITKYSTLGGETQRHVRRVGISKLPVIYIIVASHEIVRIELYIPKLKTTIQAAFDLADLLCESRIEAGNMLKNVRFSNKGDLWCKGYNLKSHDANNNRVEHTLGRRTVRFNRKTYFVQVKLSVLDEFKREHLLQAYCMETGQISRMLVAGDDYCCQEQVPDTSVPTLGADEVFTAPVYNFLEVSSGEKEPHATAKTSKHIEISEEKRKRATVSVHEIEIKEKPRTTKYYWQENQMLWERYFSVCTMPGDFSRITQELFLGDDPKMVGEGPIAGGAKPEGDSEAIELAKHSITIDSLSLDVLSCASSAGPLYTSSSSWKRTDDSVSTLVAWLTPRISIVHGKDRFGNDDVVNFDRTLFIQGSLILQTSGESDRNVLRNKSALVVRARLSYDGKRLLLDGYSPIHGMGTKEKSLRLRMEQNMSTERKFVELVLQDAGIRDIVHRHGSMLLEPRNCSMLCRSIFSRSILTSYLTIEDAESSALRLFKSLEEEFEEYKRAALEFSRSNPRAHQTAKEYCNFARLAYTRSLLSKKRILDEDLKLRTGVQEWDPMSEEEKVSTEMRGYLVANKAELERIRAAFCIIDKDGDGTLTLKELQAAIFDLGEVMTEEQIQIAMKDIDANGNNEIDFLEFATWWLAVHEKGKYAEMNVTYLGLQTKLSVQHNLRRATTTKDKILKGISDAQNGRKSILGRGARNRSGSFKTPSMADVHTLGKNKISQIHSGFRSKILSIEMASSSKVVDGPSLSLAKTSDIPVNDFTKVSQAPEATLSPSSGDIDEPIQTASVEEPKPGM